ncbi:MAG: hypothetical protein D4R67_05530 [Bacteroidetes bacterium]|nr:MAG: hypothetical protein D4R67_05530 [Bacteroidota bacterium]
MKLRLIIFILFLWFISSLPGIAQVEPENALRLDNGNIVITFDNRWSDLQKQKVEALFDVDSLLFKKAFEHLPEVTVNGITWKVRVVDANRVEVFKSTSEEGEDLFHLDDIVFLEDDWISFGKQETTRVSDASGVNVLTRFDVFNYRKGVARFYLPDRLQARHVYLSGTFNDWSTMRTPMLRNDSGWVATLDLKPGKYLYKYIIDGRWSSDPYNKLREDDQNGDFNSVIYCYNYRFFLKGFPDARQVYLGGSFNGWNDHKYKMLRVSGGWAINLYLREGTHAYKFIVDGQWILDPNAPVNRPDGRGNVNSFVSLGDTLWFHLGDHLQAKRVALAGSFNDWNGGELYMEKTADGWQLPYILGPGNFEYKFIVDGQWMPDSANPLTTGSGNFTNSFVTVKPNFAFRLKHHPDALSVLVTGSFNGWNPQGFRMMKQESQWVFPIYFSPGKYTYKFIVDGEWILDPDNDLWEENEYGTGNSVLWVEP